MKKLIFVLAAALLAVPPAFADTNGPSQRFIQRIEKQLNINEEQATKVAGILKGQHDQMRALMEKCQKENKTQFDAIQADTHKQLAGVLSEDQVKQLEDMHHNHMKRRMDRRAGPGGPNGPDGADTPDDSTDSTTN